LIIGVVTGYLSLFYLLPLLTIPMAVSLFHLMVEFVRDPKRTFSPRFWMGPMINWEKIQAANVDWFMIRWLLAHNLLTFFCFILMIVSLI
jgi:1,4-dihydroxy-2-naphthoate octaprenyltransferase